MTKARVTQVPTEALVATTPKARLSQVPTEALVATNPKARLSQLVIEVLVKEGGARNQAIIIG